MMPKKYSKASGANIRNRLKEKRQAKSSGSNKNKDATTPSTEDILFRSLKSAEYTIDVERHRFYDDLAAERNRSNKIYHLHNRANQLLEIELKAKEDAYRMSDELCKILEKERLAKEEECRLKEEQNKLFLQEQKAKEEALNALAAKNAHMEQILASRSWRWTAPIRKAEALLHNMLHIQKKHPHTQDDADMEEEEEDEGGGGPPMPADLGLASGSEVAVVITCHNYGKYLADAIESVLRQTYKPRELVVVNDSSTDETEQIAKKYESRGVQYIYCDKGHPSSARNVGAQNTSAPFLLFLDADDILVPDFISACMEKMKDPAMAIAYGRLQYFGDEMHVLEPPEFDRDALFRRNYISSHSLIRRQAFDMVGGYRAYPHSIEDWDLYRRILRFHWKAAKTQATIYYRVHSKNRGRSHPKECGEYWCGANLLNFPITIFTPFAGRWETFDAYLKGLKNLDFDPKLIRLHWFDTSGSEDFGKMLREALAALPFGRTTYSCAPLPELWNFTPGKLIEKRLRDLKAQYFYDMALVYAYNHLLVSCDTEYAFTIEDDIVVSPDALTKLLMTVRSPFTVAALASYPSHILSCQTVWKNDATGKPEFPKRRKKGIENVDGGGFGCTLLRMDAMKSMPVYTELNRPSRRWYDHIVFAHLRSQGEVLCNWDTEVEHLKTDRNGPMKKLHKKTAQKALIEITRKEQTVV